MPPVGETGEQVGAGHAQFHNALIDAVHYAIGVHPSPHAKADYGNILARLLARQAKMHAAGAQTGGHAVQGPGGAGGFGVQDPGGGGGGYVDQNLTPWQQAAVAAGGWENAGLGGQDGSPYADALAGHHGAGPITMPPGWAGFGPAPAASHGTSPLLAALLAGGGGGQIVY